MNKRQILKILIVFTIFVFLVVAGILASVLISKSRKEEATIEPEFGTLETPIEPNMTSEMEIEWQAQASGLETSEYVYELDMNSEYYPDLELTEEIVSYLGLEKSDQRENNYYFYNENQTIYVSFGDESKVLYIGFFDSYVQDETLNFSEEEAKAQAEKKLEEFNLLPSEELAVNYKYYYSAGGEYYEISDKTKANIIGVNLSQKIDDKFFVVASTLETKGIEVLVDSSKNVLSISYAYRPINKDSKASYPIKSLEEALDEIKAQRAELILPNEYEAPESMTIKQVRFAYKIVYKDESYLQPIYIFEGIDNSGQEITALVPAIVNDYLKNTD